MSKVAVVTGSNKGIGLGIVRSLCKKYDGAVYLTSRDEGRGQQAIDQLKGEGLNPNFHQLDIDSKESVEKLRNYMKEKYGGIDVLVNNAAIAFKQAATEPFGEQATVTLRTNYWNTKRACEILFPILKPGARVVNVSSSAGYLGCLDRAENQAKAGVIKKTLASGDLEISVLDSLMKQFEETANAGTHREHGWHNSTYSASKIGLSALSRIQQRELAKDTTRPDIVVSHVHPGYVDTDMTSHKGPLTIDRGAESAVFAALLPANTETRGAYIWHDCQIVDWVNGPTPPMT
eukprot:TRINITY_DN6015_c0_g1_i11.p1 TRINITY_DN6015_c0_g1~~TRINITY_DN6015_c0_g1_i11.p1  ORF type:complete len:290 (-),score=84.42 TRINITY_DN6015_c0_g1_i11:580-1449(-)